MAINYPFDRIIKSAYFNQSENELTITGQFITEKDDHNFDISSSHPKKLEASYLLRFYLEELQHQSFHHLSNENKRSLEEILRAAQIVREQIWMHWDYCINNPEPDEEDDASDYFTGSQAEEIGPKSYRTWVIYSDPHSAMETAPDDWLEHKIWRVDEHWSWADIYAVMSLWMIDESTVYLNLGNPYKASIWLMRASNYMHTCWSYNRNEETNERKRFSSLGGKARHKKTYIKRDQIIAYWSKNIGADKSNEFAAEVLQKEFPEVAHRTIARYISEAKKLPSAGTL